MALCLGIYECVPKSNMPYLPYLSVTVLIWLEFIQGHLLSNFFFGLGLKGAWLTLVKIRKT